MLASQGITTPDLYLVTLEFEKGAVATLEHCWILPESAPSMVDFKCEVVGSQGAIYLDLSHNRAIELQTKEKAGYPGVTMATSVQGKIVGFAAETFRHFIDCVIHDRQPAITGEDGLATTRVLVAIEESCSRGAPVEVSDLSTPG